MTEEFNRRASELSAADFDDLYSGTPPWDIGRPQPVFAELSHQGGLRGDVLDIGCGTGEHALLAAAQGLAATGVDLSAAAIAIARRKARERNLTVRFEVADVLQPPSPHASRYDTILDSALFHVFDDDDRARYVANVGALLRPEGRYYLLCFSDRVPGTAGPRRVSRAEIAASFTEGWEVESVQPAELLTTDAAVPAYFAALRRTATPAPER